MIVHPPEQKEKKIDGDRKKHNHLMQSDMTKRRSFNDNKKRHM